MVRKFRTEEPIPGHLTIRSSGETKANPQVAFQLPRCAIAALGWIHGDRISFLKLDENTVELEFVDDSTAQGAATKTYAFSGGEVRVTMTRRAAGKLLRGLQPHHSPTSSSGIAYYAPYTVEGQTLTIVTKNDSFAGSPEPWDDDEDTAEPIAAPGPAPLPEEKAVIPVDIVPEVAKVMANVLSEEVLPSIVSTRHAILDTLKDTRTAIQDSLGSTTRAVASAAAGNDLKPLLQAIEVQTAALKSIARGVAHIDMCATSISNRMEEIALAIRDIAKIPAEIKDLRAEFEAMRNLWK